MTQSLSPSQTDLVGLSASEMARQIAAGNLTSAELVEAHIGRIEAVNPALNAVVVPLFGQARAQAAAADAARRRGEPLGPLHGVPITIKECFHVAGTPATEGVDRFAGEIMTADNPLVRRLRSAGAIVLGKTNVPQLMLMHETDNPLYGRTQNPWDLERSPGGSSGGEAAIIAAGGSPLGLANDLGGSIRQPAHACGICGIKPTTLRLTNAGVRDNLHGMEAIRAQCGPLARSVEDLVLALGVLNAAEPHAIDPQVAPVPLGDPAQVRIDKLRIGMWTDDGHFSASPTLRRAVGEAADALGRLGAQVMPFQPPDMPQAVDLFFSLVGADGAADAARILGSSRRDWRNRRMVMICNSPRWLRSVMRAGLSAAGQRRTARLLGAIGSRSADQYWQLCTARAAFAQRFFDTWCAQGLDALICPPHALPALRHGSSEHLATAGSYCYWANLLGVPAGVVPATRVRAGDESDRPASRDIVDRAARRVENGSAGLPVGVQVAARPWREDVVLAVMAALESHFMGQNDFPRTPVEPASRTAPNV
jgi:Asp-tRNA(Asn)/Glu-tRNA(Gln) amidotransferase A subunit family amidase